MTPPPALLDTDVLSAIMRRHPTALARAEVYLASHRWFTLSVITRYESHFARIPGLMVDNWLKE